MSAPDATLPLLGVCRDLGLLALRDLYQEVALLARDKDFTSAEIVAHAALPENHRLRLALESCCGADFTPGKLGKLFSGYAASDIAGIAIARIGEEENAVVWRAQSQTRPTSALEAVTVVPLPPLGNRHVA